MQNISVFIGFDHTQKDAYRTLAYSIREHAGTPEKVFIYPVDHRDLRAKGLFKRPWYVDGPTGNYRDAVDSRPFSTEFSHSRFLVPWLHNKVMHLDENPENRWVIFMDSDFLCLRPIENLVEYRSPEVLDDGLWVVKHNYQPDHILKMAGREQSPNTGGKKLWSSLMLFDMWNFDVDNLSPDVVNNSHGNDLHDFKWHADSDGDLMEIGSLTEGWNFIPGYSDIEKVEPHLLHFTEGLPLHKGYEDGPMAQLWLRYYAEMLSETSRRVGDGL